MAMYVSKIMIIANPSYLLQVTIANTNFSQDLDKDFNYHQNLFYYIPTTHGHSCYHPTTLSLKISFKSIALLIILTQHPTN